MKKIILTLFLLTAMGTAMAQTAKTDTTKSKPVLVDTVVLQVAPVKAYQSYVKRLADVKAALLNDRLTIKDIYSQAGELSELINLFGGAVQYGIQERKAVAPVVPVKKK